MNFKYTANTLKKMEQLFQEAGFKIRFEKGRFQSGYCVLDEKKVVVINKFLDLEGRINALNDIVPLISFQVEILSPEMQKWYKMLMEENPVEASTQTQMDF